MDKAEPSRAARGGRDDLAAGQLLPHAEHCRWNHATGKLVEAGDDSELETGTLPPFRVSL